MGPEQVKFIVWANLKEKIGIFPVERVEEMFSLWMTGLLIAPGQGLKWENNP
jgi:hypothetical protein